eukprot:3473511-Prymnesium_polylepis.2
MEPPAAAPKRRLPIRGSCAGRERWAHKAAAGAGVARSGVALSRGRWEGGRAATERGEPGGQPGPQSSGGGAGLDSAVEAPTARE